MKKVFRSHFILVFEGRILVIGLMGINIWLFELIFSSSKTERGIVFGVFFLIAYTLLNIYVYKIYIMPTLYPLAFGKLIVSDKGVTFRCFPQKNIFISWADCRFCGIESYHSDIRDLYNTGRVYIYFSKEKIPIAYKGKIDKKKNEQGFIKFFPVTVKLCEEVLKYKKESDLSRFVMQKTAYK